MIRGLILASIAAAALVACAPAQQSSQSGAGAGTPKQGGTVRTWITTDPEDFDPSYGGKSIPNSYALSLAYSSLLGYKAGPDVPVESYILQPELAEKWEVSPDAKTYTFHIRQTKWADASPLNGREVTAADVKWGLEYAAREGWAKDKKLPTAQFGWMYEGLDKITTPDPQTVVVSFKEPFAPFLSYVASDYNPIMPHEIFDQDGHFHDKLVGTGPFQPDAANTQKGSRWAFKKNPTYWDPSRVYLDEVRELIIPQVSSAMAAFQTKQLDLLSRQLSSNEAATVTKNSPGIPSVEWMRAGPMHLYLNVRKAPLGDARIRQAIARVVDPDEFIKVLYEGKGGWAMAGAFQDTFTQEEIRQMQKHDLAEGQRLVKEAGFPNGVDIEFLYPGNAYGDSYITSMQLLQAQLKKAGINLVLKTADKQDESNRKKSGDFAMTHTGKSVEADVDSYLSIFLPDSKSNYGGIDDPNLTQMVLAQRRESDGKKRHELVRQAARYIYDNAYALALYNAVDYEFWQPTLKNYNHNEGTTGWPFLGVWLDR